MQELLTNLIGTSLFAWLLIFTRLGAAFMFMPGFGDMFVNPRVRLLLALAISLVLVPVLGPTLPKMPEQVIMLTFMLMGEVFFGAFIGLVARLILSTVEAAGMIIAMQISLSNASVFNPAMAAQSSLVGALLGVMAIVLLFATDMHHLMLMAVVDSYTLFVPGTLPNFGDFADTYGRLLAQSFLVATQMAAPFIVLGLIFYLGLGLLSRLMPQLQIFFVAIPLQIYVGIMLLGMMISGMMLMWLSYAQSTLGGFLDMG